MNRPSMQQFQLNATLRTVQTVSLPLDAWVCSVTVDPPWVHYVPVQPPAIPMVNVISNGLIRLWVMMRLDNSIQRGPRNFLVLDQSTVLPTNVSSFRCIGSVHPSQQANATPLHVFEVFLG